MYVQLSCMGTMDRYNRNNKGDIIRDGENLSSQKKPSIDIETFIQQSYTEAVRCQNNGQVEIKRQTAITTQEIRSVKEGYQSSTKIEYFDTKKNERKYSGPDSVNPADKSVSPSEPPLISKVKRMLNLK